ncbi:MAG TPA: Zn-dependent alcohol dehydrogenase [Hyphomicrobiaceae bacterium]|nr:Zn-dependent alcohol dehydrogenase [Hyphomicrobiaceae bacterium]
MRAAVLTEINKPLELLDLEQEPPKAGEARVQVKSTGVCLSDWHVMNGDWPFPLPFVPGHEAAGIVVELGAGVSSVKVGDHVIFSFRPNCGHCRYCSRGRSVLCNGHNDTPRYLMHDGTARLKLNGEPVNQMARIGTFSEFVVCPSEQLVPIRKDLPWAHAAIIGCSVATGVGSVIRHAKVEAGSSVLVIGCGGVGLNVVQGARLAGAATIIGVDLKDNKLEYARHFGATHTINASQTNDVISDIRDITSGGLGVDYAFDAIGSEITALQVVDAIAPGGNAVFIGMPPVNTVAPINPFQMVFQEKKITGAYYGSVHPHTDLPILADLAMAGRLNMTDLISRTYKFEEINEGFEQLIAGNVARGVVLFD